MLVNEAESLRWLSEACLLVVPHENQTGGMVETEGDVSLLKSAFHTGKCGAEPGCLRADIWEKVNPLVSVQHQPLVAAGETQHQFAYSVAVHPNQKWSWLSVSWWFGCGGSVDAVNHNFLHSCS